MKVLSMWEPWLTLVRLNVKPIETRSWSTNYRGPLALQGAQRPAKDGTQVGDYRVVRDADDGEQYLVRWLVDQPLDPAEKWYPLTFGAIVATCTLVDVVPIRQRNGNFYQDSPAEITCWPDGRLTFWRANDHPLDVTDQRPYGEYRVAGRFAWLLADIVPVDPPVPFKGGQGLSRTWEP